MAAAEPIRNAKQLKKFAGYYLEKNNMRNYALIMLGVYSALRVGDLLQLRWRDVYDFSRKQFYTHVEVAEKKTGKRRIIRLSAEAVRVLGIYADALEHLEAGGFLFVSNRKSRLPIGRIQAWRILKEAAVATGLPGNISCHSLRKTFGCHAWKRRTPAPVIMDIFNHSSYAVTRRYLGIAQDDRDKAYREVSAGLSP
jgi:integrase